jgi:hypothetical protein
MKEETENEEKGSVSKKESTIESTPVVMDASTLKLITDLQGQIDALKTKDESSLLAQLVEKIGGRGNSPDYDIGQFDFNKKYRMEDLDPDDVLEKDEWITFIAHKFIHVICDDLRQGMNVPAPFGLIKFKYESTKAIKGGRETELIQTCVYTCRSKKELEWLRGHSTFGIAFFDKRNGTLYSADIERSKALASKMISLQNIGQQELIAMAKERGINPGDLSDIMSMRAAIAIDVVDELFKGKTVHTQSTMVEQHLEAVKMGRSGVV